MGITAREVENISVQVLGSPEARQAVLQHAAVIERLRDQLPGWVARKIVGHDQGPSPRRWPVALVRFRHAPANANPKPAPREEVTACVWRVESDRKLPQLVLSAAICNHTGFRPQDVEADAAEKLRRALVESWQEAELERADAARSRGAENAARSTAQGGTGGSSRKVEDRGFSERIARGCP